jgi:nucleoside-triphosphatase THEP1
MTVATSEIWLFTGPIHSGKTSSLMTAFQQRQDVAGFLCPDRNDRRFLYDLSNHTEYPFQIDAISSPEDVVIGKYIFSADGFKKAHAILDKAPEPSVNYFIVDEIGRLELNGRGLEPAFSQCLQRLNACTIILVVRDYLLQDVIEHYNLQGAKIVSADQLQNLFNHE